MKFEQASKKLEGLPYMKYAQAKEITSLISGTINLRTFLNLGFTMVFRHVIWPGLLMS